MNEKGPQVDSIDEETVRWLRAALHFKIGVCDALVVEDREGRFVVPSLADGSYRLSAAKPGYVTTSFGALRFHDAGTPIAVANGTLYLLPGAAVEGEILVVGGRLIRSEQVSHLGAERVYWDAAPVTRNADGLLVLRERRRALGLTQRDLARIMRLTLSTVENYEQRRRHPTPDMLGALLLAWPSRAELLVLVKYPATLLLCPYTA